MENVVNSRMLPNYFVTKELILIITDFLSFRLAVIRLNYHYTQIKCFPVHPWFTYSNDGSPQGEVESISLMKPKALTEHDTGMLEFLEDIIGTSR